MLTTPRDFQREDIRRVHTAFGGRSLISWEVGLGKTVGALYYHDRYLPDELQGPTVVLVPAHLKIQWAREIEKHLGQHATILYGRHSSPETLPPLDPNAFIICNYDILCPPNWRSRMKLPDDSWLKWLLSLSPRMLVCDEGHLLGNTGTMRTSAARKLARKIPYVHILSGTPIANKPPQLWSLLNILRPDLYPSRHEFCEAFTFARRQWYGWDYKGARNLDRLHSDLSERIMVRRRKADVMAQLPAVTHTVIPVEVSLKDYHRAEADFVGWLEEESPLLARQAAKACELQKLHALKRMAGQLKVDAVIAWVEDHLENGGKLLLGAIHYAVTEPLMKAFGHRAVNVNGKMTDKQKQAAFDRFNTDKSCRVLVGNIQAAGTGWSCKSTSTAMLCELPWVPGESAQFFGRIHGIERGIPGTAAQAFWMVAAGTVEEDICQLLQVKQMWSRKAIDGLSADKDFDLYEQIKRRIKARVAGVAV